MWVEDDDNQRLVWLPLARLQVIDPKRGPGTARWQCERCGERGRVWGLTARARRSRLMELKAARHLHDDDVERRPWREGDGDSRCQSCGMRYVPWFTDHALWNVVMGGPEATEDPGGYLCPRCFAWRADGAGIRAVWRFSPATEGDA